MDNLQTKKQYYIPMEVNSTTIKDFGINPADVEWARIGHRRVRVIMVPATKEQYYEYMRPLWAEDKRRQRQELATSPDKLSAVSLEELWENTEYEVADTSNLEETVIKKAMLEELHKALDELEEIDRTIAMMYSQGHTEEEIGQVIAMSQRGVNKRKKKLFVKLKSVLNDFE
ncbi:RNA polymerase sigma factor [Eubacterium limosum]|uniref:RNA polymerase sigma factor, sigma-70 family n=1 Tax=Eubacterium limosum TaxID=1736 RepID=A0ABT5UMV8_EUBLI|nr:hypothetical protein [Eubacterium limosum]MDE1468877.1 hypothetical protein [Eubacterium limosum]